MKNALRFSLRCSSLLRIRVVCRSFKTILTQRCFLILLGCLLLFLNNQSQEVEKRFHLRDWLSKCQDEYDAFTVNNRTVEEELEEKLHSCRRRQVEPRASCEVMKNLLKKPPNTCKGFKEVVLCSAHRVHNQSSDETSYEFDCKVAKKICNQSEIGFFNTSVLGVSWTSVSPGRLESKLQFLYSSMKKTKTFFIRCKPVFHLGSKAQLTGSGHVQQFLWLFVKPEITREPKGMKETRTRPSISVIFVDSTSRTLFYRSFNRTISFLKSVETKHSRRVYDFKKLQSVSHHTYWNLDNFYQGAHALFSPQNDTFYPGRGQELFRKFRRAGYLTSYLWDLCFLHPWEGNVTNHRKLYKNFLKMTRQMEIVDIGIAESICEIALKTVRHFDVFGKNPCFNGRSILDYQLSFLHDLQEFWLSQGQSFMTFLDSNINHNQRMDFGSMLDVQLEKYLSRGISQENTMFLIFADHGSRLVPEYIATQMPEGDVDRYNPALFVILPKEEFKFFTQSQLKALRANQNRLVTHRDLHYLVGRFWKTVTEKDNERDEGILKEISTSRNCNDILYGQLHISNYCICEGALQKVSSADTNSITSFVQKELNRERRILKIKGRCKRFVFEPVSWFYQSLWVDENGKKKKTVKGTVQMKVSSNKNPDVYFLVYVEETMGTMDPHYELVLADRLDLYSRFHHCGTSLSGKRARFCVC